MIEENRQRRLRIADSIAKRKEDESEFETLVDSCGKLSDATKELVRMETELGESIKRTLTKKDVIRLDEVDQSVVGFVDQMRY